MSRLAASVALAGLALVGVTAPAFASKGRDHKELICHPVNGNGQTGTGWTLVDVDKASSHFDKDGNPKHQSHDGGVDTYAVNGACPVVPSTPTPTTPKPTKTETPCPTTTTSVPSSTATTVPTSTTTTSRPTSTSPSPSQTSSTSGPQSPSPSSTQNSQPSPTGPTSPSTPRTSASSLPSQPAATSTAPSQPSPRRSEPRSTVAPPELARTGFTGEWVFAAALLLLVGAWFIRISRKGVRRGQH